MALSCVTAAAQAEPVAFVSATHVARPQVLLADIADLSMLPCALRAGAASVPLARIPLGRGRITLSANRARERARALMPALAPWLKGGDGQILVTFDGQDRGVDARGTQLCLIANTALEANVIVAKADFASGVCGSHEASSARTYRLDAATGAVRLTRGLRAGEAAPFLTSAQLAAVLPGQALFVSAKVGPVRVERRVQAVQPSPAGHAVFVKADDGAVFSAPGVSP
jgi:hypothetical protein